MRRLLLALVLSPALFPALCRAALVIEDPRLAQAEQPAAPKIVVARVKTVPVGPWVIHRGDKLRETLEAWGKTAGWAVLWKPADVMLAAESGAPFNGEFAKVVAELFDAIPFEDLPPKNRLRVELRPDNNPPLVIVMRDEGVKP